MNARLYASDGEQDAGTGEAGKGRPRDREPGGFSLAAGAGVEQRSYHRTRCAHETCGPDDVMPPARLLGAGHLGLGYDLRYFGFRAGALGYPQWDDNRDRETTFRVAPELDLRFGRRRGFHAGLGVGSYSISTLFRPGAYAGLGVATDGWWFDLRAGVSIVFDAQLGGRAASRWATRSPKRWRSAPVEGYRSRRTSCRTADFSSSRALNMRRQRDRRGASSYFRVRR